MEKRIFQICKDGHQILQWNDCPFCCVLKNTAPLEDDAFFLEIYNRLKGKTEVEIKRAYDLYLPGEPEIALHPHIWR